MIPAGLRGVVNDAVAIRAQVRSKRDAGCIKIYRETVTSANNDWREMPKMLDHLAPGERG